MVSSTLALCMRQNTLKIVAMVFVLMFSLGAGATSPCGLTLTLTGSASSCAGHDTLTLGGASSVSQIIWQSGAASTTVDSSGGTIDTLFVPVVAGSYVAIVTGAGGCQDTSLAVVVDSAVTPSVSVTINTGDTICPGTSVTFTPAAVNAGTPSYQWYLNGTPVSSANFYSNNTLNNGDSIWVVITANAPCSTTGSATSNVVHIIVNTPVTPLVTVATGHSHTICPGTKITFTPTATNGGSNPTYQWYVSGVPVSTSRIFVDSTLIDQDSVWVVMTSSVACTTRDTAVSTPIHYVVNPIVTASVTIAANTGDTICRNDQVTLFATAINGGTNADYQWKANGINVGNSQTYIATTVLNGDVYTCVLTSTAACVVRAKDTSNAITFVVNPYPVVTVGETGGATNCSGDSIGLTATGGVSYAWSFGATGASVFTTAGTYTVTATNAYGCTAGSAPITVVAHQAVTDSLVRNVDTLSLQGTGGQFFQWYLNGSIIPDAVSANYIAGTSGSYQVSVIDSFGCRTSSAVVPYFATGIDPVGAAMSLNVYPNPNSGIFTLDCGDATPRLVTISDDLGRVVMDHITVSGQKQMDMSAQPVGLYYIYVSDDKVSRTLKLSLVK